MTTLIFSLVAFLPLAADPYQIMSTNWLNDTNLSDIVDMGITATVGIASSLFAMFVVLKVGYEYFKASIPSLNDSSAVSKVIDFDELIRLLTLMILLAAYKPLATSVSGAIKAINESIKIKNESKYEIKTVIAEYHDNMSVQEEIDYRNNLGVVLKKLSVSDSRTEEDRKMLTGRIERANKRIQNKINDIYNQKRKDYLSTRNKPSTLYSENLVVEDEELLSIERERLKALDNALDEGNEAPSLWRIIRKKNLGYVVEVVVTFLANLFTSILDGGFSAFIRVLYKILLIIGPLAIATSVFWKDKFLSWFEALLNTGLAFVVLQLLTMVKAQYFSNILNGSGSFLATLSFNLAIIACYFTVFRLTAMWIGKPLAGAMMGKAVSTIGAGVALGVAGAGMAIGALGGGAAAASAGSKAGEMVNTATRSGEQTE